MLDVDKLIQCVQNQPALWEKGCKDYSDRNVRDRSWEMIGTDMFENWAEMTNEERQEQVKEMKNKWRHIRDNFSKFINQGKTGDPAPKKKKYVYAEALTFLLQTTQKRKTSGNITSDGEGNDIDLTQEEANDNNGESCTRQTLQKNNADITFKAPKVQKSPSLNTFQSKLLEKLDNSRAEEQDADKSFLLSLLPDVKKLNPDEKLDFRLHCLQFFRDLRRRTPTTPFSFPHSSNNYASSQYPHYFQHQSQPNVQYYNLPLPTVCPTYSQGVTPVLTSPFPSPVTPQSINSDESETLQYNNL